MGEVILPGNTDAFPVTGVQAVAGDRRMFDWQIEARINAMITARIRDHDTDAAGSVHSRLNRL